MRTHVEGRVQVAKGPSQDHFFLPEGLLPERQVFQRHCQGLLQVGLMMIVYDGLNYLFVVEEECVLEYFGCVVVAEPFLWVWLHQTSNQILNIGWYEMMLVVDGYLLHLN